LYHIISLLCFPFLLSTFPVFAYPVSKVPVVSHCCPFQASSLPDQHDACSLTVLRLTSLTPSKSNLLTTAAVSSPTRSSNAAVQHPQRGRWLSKYRTVPLVPSTARSRGARRSKPCYYYCDSESLNSPVYSIHTTRVLARHSASQDPKFSSSDTLGMRPLTSPFNSSQSANA